MSFTIKALVNELFNKPNTQAELESLADQLRRESAGYDNHAHTNGDPLTRMMQEPLARAYRDLQYVEGVLETPGPCITDCARAAQETAAHTRTRSRRARGDHQRLVAPSGELEDLE